MLEPIDLRYRGLERAVGVYLLDTDDGPALADCGPATTLPTLREGLRARGLELAEIRHLLLSHIHFDHAGAAGAIVEAHPSITVWVSAIGARHLAEPSRLEASARRLYGERFDRLFGTLMPVPVENIADASGDVLGWEAFPTPGHASHHVAYLRDGTLLAGDCCGVRLRPTDGPLPVCPPPDIDIDAWHTSLAQIADRHPRRLALTHFGVATDPVEHLTRLGSELDRWTEIVEAGADVAQFTAQVAPHETNSPVWDEVAPFDQSWAGLRRYLDKRATAID